MTLKTESDPIPYQVLRYLIEFAPGGAATEQELIEAIDSKKLSVPFYLAAMREAENCWLWFDKGQYRPTSEGLDVYATASKDPRLVHKDYSTWINEARTGIDSRGNPTSIDRAAIPTGGTVARKPENVRKFEAMAVHLAGQQLGVNPSEVLDAYTKGEMKLCQTCGELKQGAAFHKDGQKKDGRASSCKICRKKKQAIPTA